MPSLGAALRSIRSQIPGLSSDPRPPADRTPRYPPLPPCAPSAVVAAPLPSATASSPLFTRLPAELRHLILVAAFGDLVVHMHLSLERPPRRPRRNARRGPVAAANYAGHPGRHAFDPDARPFWRWRSSRCHSHCSLAPGLWGTALSSGFGGDRDYCVAGESCGHPGAPESCRLGALGWLLTCREAYREGFPVLLGASTVRLHGTFMFARLPALLPPSTLESLVSVALFWDLGWLPAHPRPRPRPGDHPEEYDFMEGLLRLLARLPSTLPSVRRLHLSLQCGDFGEDSGAVWRAYGARCPAVHARVEGLARMVLAEVLRMPQLSEFRLALPRSMFMPWVQEELAVTLRFEEACWAELPAEALRREVPADLTGGEESVAEMDSYWVVLGVSDLPPLTIRCFC
ncbi:hypothetical protein ISF_08872 [Cordyceps fumosorosea ARSEF 2679]|uniref:Uncharacterized protein n=1 Tax=Cordyceps fumosorosea (strain ARSEF 2679) TaxID=1081104 RepID=A0A162K4L5_CORFA|nr:hypothetical protein ISF_08872 [Cordyceps fumosorosea ARSEF 2679]OAA53258.1 hypothetical protein ISF_08872 [Cordyceps fumosorosea ARSEF 2679]